MSCQPPGNLSGSWAFNLEGASESPEGLTATQAAGPTPRVSESVFLGWGTDICISNKFQVMLVLPFKEPHFKTHSLANVFQTPYFTSKIALGIQALAVNLTALVMGTASESYLGSVR